MEKMTEVRRAFIGKRLVLHDSWCGGYDVLVIKDIKKRRNGCYEFYGEHKTMMVEDDVVKSLLESRKKVERREIDRCAVVKEWSIWN